MNDKTQTEVSNRFSEFYPDAQDIATVLLLAHPNGISERGILSHALGWSDIRVCEALDFCRMIETVSISDEDAGTIYRASDSFREDAALKIAKKIRKNVKSWVGRFPAPTKNLRSGLTSMEIDICAAIWSDVDRLLMILGAAEGETKNAE